MGTLEFFLAAQNGPFLVAGVITLVIVVVQVVGLLFGLAISEALDNLLPDLDVDADIDLDADVDADVDADIGGDETGIFERVFGWLNIGRVPVLVLLIIFLTSFAVIGYVIQSFTLGVIGLLPGLIAGGIAFAVALPITRTASRLFARIIPREETYAISLDELVGRTARVTLGPVDRRTPGKARLTDAHGNVHFVRVRAARKNARFDVNAEVLLVERHGAVFEAILPPHSLDTGT